MKVARVLRLTACVLLLSSAANAGILRVPHSLDWTANGWGDGPWFIIPNEILDHSPYYRGMLEDWGWTHDLTHLVPAEAIGIQSATLTINAWDVDVSEDELDVIYANGVELGALEDTGERLWKTTSFDLPASVLDDIWADGELYVFIDIDTIEDFVGHRVTLMYSTLMVDYIMPESVPGLALAVQRFWSPTVSSHFYTTSEPEKEKLIYGYSDKWTYESIAFYAFADGTDLNALPVYRFWSDSLGVHFYTISETERDKLLVKFSHIWTYEGLAFYAYPEGQQPSTMSPVYRFWSAGYLRHFYTASEREKQKLIDNYSHIWTFEGIAYYAYRP
jgi:hypothetical protein